MKRKLLFAMLCIVGVLGLRAQTDVTSTYITNPSFESCSAFGSGNAAAASSAAGTDYNSEGWKLTTSAAWCNSAVFEYGSAGQINGRTIPATDPYGNTGKGLAFSAGWGGNQTYQSASSVTLPAGTYTLVAPTFNAYNGAQQFTSKLGFVPTSGDAHLSKKTSFTSWSWEYDVVTFTLAAETEGKFQVGGSAISGGSTSNAMIVVDGLTLYSGEFTPTAEFTGTAFRYDNTTTDLLNNGSFDTDKQGWTLTNMGYQQNGERPTRYVEKYQSGGIKAEGSATQTLNSMPAGAYIFRGTFNLRQAETKVKMKVGTEEISIDKAGWNDYEILYNHTSTGNIEVKYSFEANLSSDWIAIDGFSLIYGGNYSAYEAAMHKGDWDLAVAAANAALNNSDYANVIGSEKTALQTELNKAEPNTADGYDQARDNLNAATATFTSAKANYDAFVAEKAIATNIGVTSFPTPNTAAEALEGINELKVSEYTYVTTTYDTDGSALFIPSWDKSNFDALSNEHWSGKTSEYFDKWSGSAFDSKIYKTVTLPEGHYAFYAAARGQAGKSTATLKVSFGETNLSVPCTIKGNRGYGINTTGAADFSPSSAYACNNEGYGWEWRFITFDLDAESEVTLSIECSGNNSWVSAGDTKLLTYDNIAVSRQNYEAALTAAQAYEDVDMFTEDKTDLNTVISENTLTIGSATQSELNAATANLNAATEKAAVDVQRYTTYTNATTTIDGGTNVNLTSLIVNPSFESDFTGWTNTGSMAIQTNTSFGKTGSKYVEFWQPNGTKGVSQVISVMPAGVYVLTADVKARGVTSAKIFAGSTETNMTIGDTQNTYSATVEIADKTALTIGFEGVGTGAGSSWFALDNFTLTYYKSIADLPYTLAAGKMGTDKDAAQSTAETTFNDNPTIENYNALLAAIADAEVSVVNYTNLKAAIDAAKAVRDANNFVTAEATTAFESAITTAENAWTDVTYTDAQATTAITSLGATAGSDRAGAAGQYMASAWGKTNENWNAAPYINTWSVEANTDGSDFYVPFFEYFIDNTHNLEAKTMTATLTGLENGMYEVELWARVQRRIDADFNGDNSMITMSVNDGDAQSIMSNTENNVGTEGSVMRLGRYTARGEVTDGTLTLTIDVKLGSNVHWLSWRDVKYTKLEEANMTITAGKYGTFVAPFDVTIPKGVTAQKVTGVTGSTLDFEGVTTTIPANTPVVVSSDADVDQTFYGKDNSAGAETVTAGKLVGIYKPVTIPAGCYVLQTQGDVQAFYKLATAATANTVNRAYLNVDANVKTFFFNDEDADGINAVEATAEDGRAIYNLAGQRVKKAQKGLYIIGGKTVLVK